MGVDKIYSRNCVVGNLRIFLRHLGVYPVCCRHGGNGNFDVSFKCVEHDSDEYHYGTDRFTAGVYDCMECNPDGHYNSGYRDPDIYQHGMERNLQHDFHGAWSYPDSYHDSLECDFVCDKHGSEWDFLHDIHGVEYHLEDDIYGGQYDKIDRVQSFYSYLERHQDNRVRDLQHDKGWLQQRSELHHGACLLRFQLGRGHHQRDYQWHQKLYQ